MWGVISCKFSNKRTKYPQSSKPTQNYYISNEIISSFHIFYVHWNKYKFGINIEFQIQYLFQKIENK